MGLQDLVYLFGYGLCHQLPERSLQAGGIYLAVCARDTGIHVGFAAALLTAAIRFGYLKAKGKPLPADLPPWPMLVLISLLIVPLAIDGLSSYAGLRETTNTIRFITGALAGLAGGTLVAPVLNQPSAYADVDVKAFATPLALVGQLSPGAALATVFWLAYPSLGMLSVCIAVACLLTLVLSLNLMVFGVTVIKESLRAAVAWLPWLACACLAALIELAAFDLIRLLFLDRLLGQQGFWSWL